MTLTPEEIAEIDERMGARMKEFGLAAENTARVFDGFRIIVEEFACVLIKRMLRDMIIGRRQWESKRKLRGRRWKGVPWRPGKCD